MPLPSRLLLALITLFFSACARTPRGLPPPPEAPNLTAVARLHLTAPGKRLSARTVILVRPGILYAEALSPWGEVLFRLWFRRGTVVWVEGPQGPMQAFRFRPFPDPLDEVLPYLLLGRWPPGAPLELGKGYRLKLERGSLVLTFLQRPLLKVSLKPQGVLLHCPPLHTTLELRLARLTPGGPEIPPLPRITPQSVDLRSLLLPEGD